MSVHKANNALTISCCNQQLIQVYIYTIICLCSAGFIIRRKRFIKVCPIQKQYPSECVTDDILICTDVIVWSLRPACIVHRPSGACCLLHAYRDKEMLGTWSAAMYAMWSLQLTGLAYLSPCLVQFFAESGPTNTAKTSIGLTISKNSQELHNISYIGFTVHKSSALLLCWFLVWLELAIYISMKNTKFASTICNDGVEDNRHGPIKWAEMQACVCGSGSAHDFDVSCVSLEWKHIIKIRFVQSWNIEQNCWTV